MWAQETRRELKSQQIRINLIYMYCPNTTCPPSYHQNGFRANVGLGHTHAQLHPWTPMLHTNCTWLRSSVQGAIQPLW